MRQEFNQINRKVQGDKKILKINLDVKKFWWFGSQKSKETGQTGGKIGMKIYVSRIIPNDGMRTRHQHKV